MSSWIPQHTYEQQYQKMQHITVRHLLPVAAPCPEQDAYAPAGF